MLDTMYKFVTPWATASKRHILKNRIMGRVANYIYPVYCKLFPIKTKENEADEKVVVSLTSFPARIDKIHLCINSILRQTRPADKVVLWLARTQFPEKSKLPQELLTLENYGLEIKFCEDLRSYKKIYFAAQEYKNSIIITADDDTLYPEFWIKRLLETHMRNMNYVCCYRAHKIIIKNDGIAPYDEWISMSPGEKGPSILLIPIGVGGVLYPVGFFKDVEFKREVIRELCPTTDDLWLKILGVKNGYKVVKVDADSKEWFTLLKSQNNALTSTNVGEKVNDISIQRLVAYYKIDYKVMKDGEE